MPFYHASRSVYPTGHVIKIPDGENSRAYELSLQLGNKWREDVLKAGRMERAWPRQTAVYAANSPGNAARLLVAQHDAKNRPVHVYEVDVSNKSPSPMVLIGYMDDRGPSFAKLGECVEEYWSPVKNWAFLEYVCGQMTVVSSLRGLDANELYASEVDYGNDRQQVRNLWGVPPPKAPAGG